MMELQLQSARLLATHSGAATCYEGLVRSPGYRFHCHTAMVEFGTFALWPILQVALSEGLSGVRRLTSVKVLSRVQIHSYLFCAIVMAIGHTTGLTASQYLNYTTVIVFKSAKVPAVVLTRALMTWTVPDFLECFLAFCMMAGLVVFGLAENNTGSERGFIVSGLLLVALNLVFASVCANLQQHLLQHKSAGPMAVQQLLVFQYSAAAGIMGVICACTHELSEAAEWYSTSGYQPIALLLGDCVLTTLGMEAIYRITEVGSAAQANAVCGARKVISFVLSFAVYWKPLSWLHVAGAILTIGSSVLMQHTRASRIDIQPSAKNL